MAVLNNIEKLRGWCHKILPLVYDDSLSYYEVVCKVKEKLNEVIDLTAEQNEVIEEMVQEIASWEATTDGKYDDFVELVDGKITEFEGHVNDEITTFEGTVNQTIADFIHDVCGDYDEYKNYKVGEFCYYEGVVYSCRQISTADFPRPFNAYGWFNYRNQDLYSVLNDLFKNIETAKSNMWEIIYGWINQTCTQWNPNTAYHVGDYCSMIVSTVMPSSNTPYYYKCIQDNTGIAPPYQPTYWEQVVLVDALRETMSEYKQDMIDDYNQFLEDYQRTWGIVQTTGTSTTDAMSQDATTTELAKKANIDDLETGELVVNKATMAKGLEPVSKDSGVTQDTPFIAQGTGTGNGTTSVDTSDTAQNLQKNGNTVVVNQWIVASAIAASGTDHDVTFTNNGDGTITANGTADGTASFQACLITVKIGHTYLMKGCPAGGGADKYSLFGTEYGNGVVFTASAVGYSVMVRVYDGFTANNLKFEPKLIDITQWFNGNIPQDLLDHPENWGRYYAGSLAYNSGTITDCSGRYLRCGQGRQLWDEQIRHGTYNSSGVYTDNDNYTCSKNFIPVIPKKPIYLYNGSTFGGFRIVFFDKDKNFISRTDSFNSNLIQAIPSNCWFIQFFYYGTTYGNNITISLYYTTGDGYNKYYPYVAPKVYDTGTEPLKAFDYKTNDGVVHTETGSKTIASTDVQLATAYDDIIYYYVNKPTDMGGYNTYDATTFIDDKGIINGALLTNKVGTYLNNANKTQIWFGFAVGTTLAQAQAALDGMNIEYPLADSAKTTTQGTTFAENIDINDYSDMAWYDTNDDLVETPQGCTIFYVAAYVPFLDSVYMREDIDGDPEQIVSQTELGASETARDAVDTQLKNAVGGTLRQCLCVKATLDFDNTNFVDLSELGWVYDSTYSRMQATPPADIKYASGNDTPANLLCTKYKTGNVLSGTDDVKIGVGTIALPYLYVYNTGYTDATTFKSAMKGVLLAYEKA